LGECASNDWVEESFEIGVEPIFVGVTVVCSEIVANVEGLTFERGNEQIVNSGLLVSWWGTLVCSCQILVASDENLRWNGPAEIVAVGIRCEGWDEQMIGATWIIN